ncbi:endonuclease III [Pseudomonadota bacterium]
MKNLPKILELLKNNYKSKKTELTYKTPFEMLVATILSAQCTDARVNMVTPGLFKKFRNVKDFADADAEELQQAIRSTGFFRNKAKNIQGAANGVIKNFNGEVPRTMEELITLPGVARKTANVVLYNAYGKVEGVTVDTHVGRLSRRLGLSKEKNAEKVERDLMELIPKKDWGIFPYQIIDHGRKVCKSVKPDCKNCFLNKVCPSAGDFDKKGKWIGVK